MVIASHKNFLVFFLLARLLFSPDCKTKAKTKTELKESTHMKWKRNESDEKKTEFEKRKQTIERKQSSRFAKSNFAYT